MGHYRNLFAAQIRHIQPLPFCAVLQVLRKAPSKCYRPERQREGCPLPDDTWQSILACARSVGVPDSAVPAVR